MKPRHLSASVLAVGLGLLATTVPTSSTPAVNPPARATAQKDGKAKQKPGELTELPTTGWATLTGTVTYDGIPPEPKKINMLGNKDKDACHEGASERELVEQTWLVNKENKGVSDVVIFVRPPEGKFFKIHPSYLDMKNPKNKFVELRQPHCAFVPHVLVYWASYYDKETGEQKPSGQKIKIVNDAKFNHNVNWAGDPAIQPRGSVTLAPQQVKVIAFNAQPDSPIAFKCDIHPWMSAKCWALDTPYCARTDENGKFQIENVPAGAAVRVIAWHDGAGYFYGGKAGKLMTLDGKQFILNIKVRAK
jgi:hypothetical protein